MKDIKPILHKKKRENEEKWKKPLNLSKSYVLGNLGKPRTSARGHDLTLDLAIEFCAQPYRRNYLHSAGQWALKVLTFWQ